MNRETFTQHIRQELSSLRRFLLAACSGNGNEADDVAQEVLMKAYVASRRFEDEEGFSAWLYRIACNTLIDHQRKQMTRGETIGIDKAHDVAGVSRSDDSFEYQELRHYYERGRRNGERLPLTWPRASKNEIKQIRQI